MACMTMLTLASCSAAHSSIVLANYGSRSNKRAASSYARRDRGLGLTRSCFTGHSNFCNFGNNGQSGRSSFRVYSGAEKVGFVGGGGDVGGRGKGGDGGGGGSGDDFNENSRDDSSHGFGSALWIWYNNVLENHPLIAKSVTSALLNAVADSFCQVFVEKVASFDWKRFWSFVAIGLFLSGPGLHYWYGALPKIITVPGLPGVLLRIALDQVVFTPLGMLSFFVILLALENRQDEIRRKLEKDWAPTVFANWKVWIPFQIVNFSMVPAQLQVPAAGLLGMVWSVFISYKGHT
ncbi:hypothetical protein R1sor_019866 [Riccia sorocarpa]|uniref:Uncharacterized protein n=1 Tax=Riccia sorocarpa TaxID=122646 RepID=A0ABD3IFD7_9MARC